MISQNFCSFLGRKSDGMLGKGAGIDWPGGSQEFVSVSTTRVTLSSEKSRFWISFLRTNYLCFRNNLINICNNYLSEAMPDIFKLEWCLFTVKNAPLWFFCSILKTLKDLIMILIYIWYVSDSLRFCTSTIFLYFVILLYEWNFVENKKKTTLHHLTSNTSLYAIMVIQNR